MRYRIAMALFSAALLAAPFATAQGRGGWAAPSDHRGGGGGGDHHGNGTGNFFPSLSSQPWAVPAWVTGAGPRPAMPERTFGRHTTIVVGLPYYLPPYSSYSSLDYYNGSSYNRQAVYTPYGQPVYTPPAEGQIVVVEPQNARGPQDSREALLERRLDDQAVELDNLRRERNAGAQIPARQSLADGEELQPATILVFKDKRPSELIHNYAVVGSNLYVMGRNHRKIPLEDLDLTATARANEKAGLEFKIPQTSGAMKLKSGLGINR